MSAYTKTTVGGRKSTKTFDQKVRELSAEYGIYDIPVMADIMGIPYHDAQRLVNPRSSRHKQPTPWFQRMFLELYKQKLEAQADEWR